MSEIERSTTDTRATYRPPTAAVIGSVEELTAGGSTSWKDSSSGTYQQRKPDEESFQDREEDEV
jgi:hypothetical protein